MSMVDLVEPDQEASIAIALFRLHAMVQFEHATVWFHVATHIVGAWNFCELQSNLAGTGPGSLKKLRFL